MKENGFKFTYPGSRVSLIETDKNTLAKTWTVLDKRSVIWKSDLNDKIKRSGRADTAVCMHYMDANFGEKAWRLLHKNAARNSTPQSSCCTATYHPSREISMLDKPDRQDTWCSLQDLPEVIDDREGWRERVRDNRADSATWWWWWNCKFPCSVLEIFSHLYRHSVGWGCRIRRLHLCREVRHYQRVFWIWH